MIAEVDRVSDLRDYELAAVAYCRALPDASVQDAVCNADSVCTSTSASEPILNGACLKPGAQISVVRSGFAGTSEVDHDVVTWSRYFVDSCAGELAQGSELLRAKAAGLIGGDHIWAKIGEVSDGSKQGRKTPA